MNNQINQIIPLLEKTVKIGKIKRLEEKENLFLVYEGTLKDYKKIKRDFCVVIQLRKGEILIIESGKKKINLGNCWYFEEVTVTFLGKCSVLREGIEIPESWCRFLNALIVKFVYERIPRCGVEINVRSLGVAYHLAKELKL